ncbi:MAG: hypothetical protein ACLQCU_06915 [Acidimicrobiales bacterium]
MVAVQLGKRVELMARFDALANPAAGRRHQHAARDGDRAIAAGLDVILRGLQNSDARFGPPRRKLPGTPFWRVIDPTHCSSDDARLPVRGTRRFRMV